jgi:3-oxoacyl-[acyl-carrier protein] reductase
MITGKHMLIFAATGEIGRQTAALLAEQGAHVWLSARRQEPLDALVKSIRDAGGQAEGAVVDATDSDAVTRYVDSVASRAGRIDSVFNAIGGRPKAMGFPELAVRLSVENFLKPIELIVGSTFLTSRVVGSCMIEQGHGSIVTLSATLSVMALATMTGLTTAYGAMEALTRTLAGDFGPAGVRVNCVRANGMPETSSIHESYAEQTRLLGRAPNFGEAALQRPITIRETASAVAYLASDHASGITGQTITVCGGQFFS